MPDNIKQIPVKRFGGLNDLTKDIEKKGLAKTIQDKYPDDHSAYSKFEICLESEKLEEFYNKEDVIALLECLKNDHSLDGKVSIKLLNFNKNSIPGLRNLFENKEWPNNLPLNIEWVVKNYYEEGQEDKMTFFEKMQAKDRGWTANLDYLSRFIEFSVASPAFKGYELSINLQLLVDASTPFYTPTYDVSIHPEDFNTLKEKIAGNTSAYLQFKSEKFIKIGEQWVTETVLPESEMRKYFIRNHFLHNKELSAVDEKEMCEAYYLAGIIYNDQESPHFDINLALACFENCGEYLPALKALLPIYISAICDDKGKLGQLAAYELADRTARSIIKLNPNDCYDAAAFIGAKNNFPSSAKIYAKFVKNLYSYQDGTVFFTQENLRRINQNNLLDKKNNANLKSDRDTAQHDWDKNYGLIIYNDHEPGK